MYVLQLCSVLSRPKAEITRNRNGHTRSLKRSHFGMFSIVNRPYFKLFHVTHQVNGSSRNLTPRDTKRDAFMDKYIRVQELIFRLSRDVSLGRPCSNSQASPQHPGVVRLYKRVLFFDYGWAGYLTYLVSPISM